MSPTVVVEGAKLGIRLRNSANAPSPPVSAFSVFVDEVAKMDNVVDTLFTSSISESVEEPEVQVRARVDGKRDFGSLISLVWCGLRRPNWARIVRIADVKLVVVLGECCKSSGLDLSAVKCGSRDNVL